MKYDEFTKRRLKAHLSLADIAAATRVRAQTVAAWGRNKSRTVPWGYHVMIHEAWPRAFPKPGKCPCCGAAYRRGRR